jgi:serine/threonine protein phosphatase 1
MLLDDARPPDDTRLYAIGDIHGCIRQLVELIDAIDADLKAFPVKRHRIITLGDYVDRGPDSKAVLQFLIECRKTRPMICLRGNHDQRMLEFIDVPDEVGEAFLQYGGRELLSSYGIDPDTTTDLAGLSKAFGRKVPREHIDFLDSLALSHVEQDYFFCHAGIRPGVPLDEQEPNDLIWIRNRFLVHQGAHPKVIVHGHTPRDTVDIQPNRINLDTECYFSGILSCVVLEGCRHRLLQT